MGMNYYLEVCSQETKQEILKAVQNDHFEIARRLLNENPQIHIGKSSGGWQFTFNHHNWKYYNSVESLQAWLKSGTIICEYGTQVTFEDFWKTVEIKKNDRGCDICNFGLSFSSSIEFS